MKTPTTALKRKLIKRGQGSYSLAVTLDSRFCARHGLESGDTVSIFEHPSRADILCVQVDRKARRSKPTRKVKASQVITPLTK